MAGPNRAMSMHAKIKIAMAVMTQPRHVAKVGCFSGGFIIKSSFYRRIHDIRYYLLI